MVISIYIAYAYNEDRIYDKHYLSLVSGLSKSEVISLENEFLHLIEFNLFVREDIFEQYKKCFL